jgi:predicted Zn-dependent protease
MTVRSKPLLILSGFFLVVAAIGVATIILSLSPRSTQAILKLGRTAQRAGRYADAEIHYKQALQLETKSAVIHEEMAGLYKEWIAHAPAEKKAALRHEWLDHLVSAAKYDKALKTARRELLHDAMELDLVPDSLYWAKEVLSVEPENPDAHYVQAADALDRRAPNIPEIRRHQKVLEDKKAPLARRLWVRARLADVIGDAGLRDEALAEAAKLKPESFRDPVDLLARIRLAALAVSTQRDAARLDSNVRGLLGLLPEFGDPRDLAPSRITRLRSVLETAQRSLIQRNGQTGPDPSKTTPQLVDAIEVQLDAIFRAVLSSEHQVDLRTYVDYADHLRFLQKRDRCLEICDQALKLPQAARASAIPSVTYLHTIALGMALLRSDDQRRLEKAAPHIKALLASTDSRAQGFGHFFAGCVDLERFSSTSETSSGGSAEAAKAARETARGSALKHLKIAAAQLPDIAEAQARYGVALVLAGEQNLGRQYLQSALRIGSLDPHDQLWAAWTIFQAGYPEEAQPIVAALIEQLPRGDDVPKELAGPLHLLYGELYQAKRAPEDLQKAREEFDKALSLGQEATATIVLRQAQLDIRLKHHDQALMRLDSLSSQGKGGPAVEHVAVLTLEELGKIDQARSRLEKARAAYPSSNELAALDAALLVKHEKPADADRVLAEFLAKAPDNPSLVMMRAQIQIEHFKQADRARELLESIANRTEDSRPLVQLFGLELDRNRLDLAAAVIAKVKTRWKESSTGDVLDAQLALKKGNIAEAVGCFDAALKKDPENKMVQFWKAQIESRTGAVAEAAKTFESLVKDKPVKEVDPGVTMMAAAQSALASLSLRSGYYQDAIQRFEDLRKNNEAGTLARADRWQLITAYANRGEWTKAKAEIASLLENAESPPSDDDRVRAASFYAQEGDRKGALAQLDLVRRKNPTHAQAVVTLAGILLKAKEAAKAAEILRQAIEISGRKDKPPAVFYLMLAVVENQTAPADTALKRAIAALDQGLTQSPDADELVRAKYAALAGLGDKKAALEFVEAKAKQYPKGPLRYLLVSAYRDSGLYARAEELLKELHRESPDDVNLAAALVRVVAMQAEQAKSESNMDLYRQLDARALALVREYRARYPSDLALPQVEFDLAAQRGDYKGAAEVTREVDKIASTSTVGPMLRARLAGLQNRPRETVSAYSEVLERAPRQLDVRVSLGQLELKLGEPDAALRQAKLVLDVDNNRPDALVLEAIALSESGSTASQKAANCQLAASRLEAAIKDNPRCRDAALLEAYHALAEVHLKRGDTPSALGVLRRNLTAEPRDPVAAGLMVQVLAQKRPDGKEPTASEIAQVKSTADQLAQADDRGGVELAVALGLHKAGQFDLALPHAAAAAAKLNSAAAHLHYGDLLLTIAERETDAAKARGLFETAVEQYTLVLKTQPNSVEAVNNEAWILHSYLGQTKKALELVTSLRKRIDPDKLPGEFYDTLGAILESQGQRRDAEQAYLDGLKRSPDHPVLNFHFGKLISSDPERVRKAKLHLTKALAARDRLSPGMSQEADRLIRLVNREKTQK